MLIVKTNEQQQQKNPKGRGQLLGSVDTCSDCPLQSHFWVLEALLPYEWEVGPISPYQ